MYFVGSMFSPSVFVPSSKGPPSVHAGIFGVVQEPDGRSFVAPRLVIQGFSWLLLFFSEWNWRRGLIECIAEGR